VNQRLGGNVNGKVKPLWVSLGRQKCLFLPFPCWSVGRRWVGSSLVVVKGMGEYGLGHCFSFLGGKRVMVSFPLVKRLEGCFFRGSTSFFSSVWGKKTWPHHFPRGRRGFILGSETSRRDWNLPCSFWKGFQTHYFSISLEYAKGKDDFSAFQGTDSGTDHHLFGKVFFTFISTSGLPGRVLGRRVQGGVSLIFCFTLGEDFFGSTLCIGGVERNYSSMYSELWESPF